MVVDLRLTRRQSNENSSDSTSPLPTGATIGIVCGIVALLIAVTVLFIMYWRRQRRIRQEDEWLANGGAGSYHNQYPVGAYPAGIITPMTHSGPFYTMDYKMDGVKGDSPQTQSPETFHSWQTLSFAGDKSLNQMASAMPTHPAYIPRAFVRPSTSPPAGSPTGSYMISNIDWSRQQQPPIPAIYEPEYVPIPVALSTLPKTTTAPSQSTKLPALIIPTQGRFMRSKRASVQDPNATSVSHQSTWQSAASFPKTMSSSTPTPPTALEPLKNGASGSQTFRDRAGSLLHAVSLSGPGRDRPLSSNGNVISHAPDQPRGVTESTFVVKRPEIESAASGDSEAKLW